MLTRRTLREPLSTRGAAVACTLILVAACSDEPTELPHPALVSVVASAELSLTVGDTIRIAADVRDQWGIEHSGAAVTWSSSDAQVAAVDPSGLVTATGAGTAAITATAGDASGSVQLSVSTTPSDREILEILYHATDGDNWVNNENWLTDAELGEWYGVGVDTAGRVVELTFNSNNLNGPLPPELGNLGNLTHLNLRLNELTGSIPPELGNLTNLTSIFLHYNDLTGSIPPELGNLTNLMELNPSSNDLTGSIPPELGNLTNLTELNLSWNELTGSIPPELGNLTNLTSIFLHYNELTGSIPPELGNLANLMLLNLSENDLIGPIPPELGNLTNSTELNLSWNELTGSIPPELANLTNLRGLRLDVNALTGSIPPDLGNLGNLTNLHLSHNELTGSIPSELGDLTNLTSLFLHYNELTGSIPPELGNLGNLAGLGLHNNSLTGVIPPEFGNLANLEALYLLGNDLAGPIPSSFLQLEGLGVFLIGSNERLCVPGISAFIAWMQEIPRRDEESVFCNAGDVAALKLLYETAGGTDWSNATGWTEDGAVEEWYGVDADSLGRIVTLDLADNGLNGRLPQTMGVLTEMRLLRINENDLSGRLPGSLVQVPLRELRYAETDLCAPAEDWFQAWLNGIQTYDGTGVECAPLSDREILEVLHEATGGASWSRKDNWLTDAPLSDWYGVTVNGQGDVTQLYLVGNDLAGPIPPEIGNLANLSRLVLTGNALIGPIPPEIGNLANLSSLVVSRNALTGPLPPELGNLSNLSALDLTDNALTGPIPPEIGNLVNLSVLYLADNALTGPIPPEIGNLADLLYLDLGDNALTGPIPPEIGNLANLSQLYLGDNALTGPIPPEIGNLVNLVLLYAHTNDLTGTIPPELGNLANLSQLVLTDNALTGAIPPQLGNLTSIEWLFLNDNHLEGRVSPALGGMSSLRELRLSNNGDMAGALPTEMTRLSQLDALAAGGTGLCALTDPAFQTWLAGVYRRRIKQCVEADPPAAYLVQAVQSREWPVPLVAGKRALLRVFPTARLATDATMPAVRARLYRAGTEVQIEIPGKSTPIPTEVDESSLSNSANVEIPDYLIWPGLEMVIEIDPYGTLEDSLGVVKRIPETGRLALDVREMPLFDLTLIPFVWTETHDSSIVDLTGEMAADPYGHEMFRDMRLLPVGDMAVTAHEPVLSSSNSAWDLLRETVAIRAMEGGTGHYKGMMSWPVTGARGISYGIPAKSSFSLPGPGIIAHELGHNLGLYHAPCGAGGPDPSFPYSYGTTGAWGYDFREGELVRPRAYDLMSYCGPKWISDYHFTSALNFRLSDADSVGLPRIASSATSLLLWGGIDADSVPFLEPAFVVDAPPTLPGATGGHSLTGHSDSGTELFSLSFDMPVIADGDGSSSFVFISPAEASWEGSLATITLTGPGGSVTLDAGSDLSMAILRDPQTGQVRGILRDVPAAVETAGDAVGRVAGQGLEVLFSRGIPSVDAWRR